MKKYILRPIAFVTAFIILFSCAVFTASASMKPGIAFSSDKKDDQLIVSLYYTDIEGMTGTWFTLNFDSKLITPVAIKHSSSENKDAWSEGISGEKYIEAYNFKNNEILYTGAFLEDISSVTKNTDKVHFADIIFDIRKGESAQVNGSQITVDAVICLPGEKHKIKADYIIDPATDPELPARRYAGDVDNDGKVTASDARRIIRYSVALEDIPVNDIAYANMDFNDVVSAADARLALRTSVGLEQLHSHYFAEENGKYICGYCKQTFEIRLIHVHKYNYADCYSTGVCSCGAKNSEVRGHVYSTVSPLCSVCGFDVGAVIENAQLVCTYTEKINKYRANALTAYNTSDWYTVIEALLYINVYYEEIIDVLECCDDFAIAREEFMKVQKITCEAADSLVSYSGDINISQSNASKAANALSITLLGEKTAVEHFNNASAQYLK